MSKYIDAEKLIAEIKRYKNKADERLKIKGRTLSEEQKDLALQNLCGNLLHFINTHQQEQSKVDLEKEIHEYFEGWRINYYSETEELLNSIGCTVDFDDVKDIARHFAEWGATHLNARKEINLEKLGGIARHLIAVKDYEEDMRLDEGEWLLLERIGYPERFNTRKEG